MKDKKEYYSAIGEFVMKFGNVETFIFLAPKLIVYFYFKDNPELNKIIRLLKNDGDRLNDRIQYLKKIVDVYVENENKPFWFEFISEVESLSQFRNTILHHSWYYDLETDSYSKVKNLDFNKEKFIEVNEIELKNIKMDFLERQIGEINQYLYYTRTGEHKDILEMYHLDKRLRIK